MTLFIYYYTLSEVLCQAMDVEICTEKIFLCALNCSEQPTSRRKDRGEISL